ncbi:GntR family transcriptional regulator [Actinomadura opuntiae]|uniref:GntR family transcriptional regulator n=1 Tax=Actinomadura sp. OS1-43 TaxID=604315 RepID=UPI00255AD8B5|nr:GntR family transcriptional regulator [Actinomadura sp. OS1-43]MDL4817753.1 GntR family transcriptional regulator [Actinomadura sp. OS1-43]
MVERDQHNSPHQAILDDLQAKIKSGDLPPDTRLPSEDELAAQWSCEPSAARRALIALRNVGAIYFRRGQGAFVAKNPPLVRTHWDRFQRPHTQPTYRQEADRAGMELQMEHSTERAEAPAGVAERLGIDEGAPVTETSYFISMGGKPVSFSVAWEPLAITGGTDIELPHEGPHGGKGIVPRFDAIGYAVDLEEEVLQVRMPEPHEEIQLEMPAGVPVIQVWQTFWANDVPVEVAKIIFRADRYEFQYRTVIA